MSGDQQYAPGDPVLVPGVFSSYAPNPGIAWVGFVGADKQPSRLLATIYPVRAADVHPAPPTPDPRDVALAAVRNAVNHAADQHPERKVYELREDGVVDYENPMPSICGGCTDEWDLRALEDGELQAGEGVHWPCPATLVVRSVTAALRAEEATAGAPATTEDTCPDGCGCRKNTNDADSNDCACGGPCQYEPGYDAPATTDDDAGSPS